MTTNVLYVTRQLREAEFLEHEVGKIAPHLHVDISPGPEDALNRLAEPGRYEAILLEPLPQDLSGLSLIAGIREQNPSLAIIVLIRPAADLSPLQLLEAGVDDFIVKKPGFARSLPSVLQRTMERRKVEAERCARPLRVLFAGDLDKVRRYFCRAPQITLEAAGFGPDGISGLSQEPAGQFPFDAVVLDDSTPGVNIWRELKDITLHAPDAPVILMIAPGNDATVAQAIRLGAAECIVKSGDYLQRLVPVLDDAIQRRMQVRELAAVRATEMRLRLLIESVPSCVVLLAQDGMFQAMNWAGLPLVGAGRVDEVVGKNICTLLGGESAEQLRGFLARVCGGEKGTHEFEWAGMNGRLRKLVLRAVPFHRKADGPPGVLGVIDTAAASAAPPAQAAVSEEQLADWKTALEAARTEASRVEAERSAERDGWHQTRTELETRIEGLQARLELLQSEHATAVEQRQAEAAGREEAAKELERLREVSKMTHAAISDDRESLRACLADLTGKHREEQAELEALRAENARLREVCLTTEESLRAAESRQAQEPPTELATVAMQAVIELETPLKECGELVRQSLDAGDPRRRNAERLIELAGRAGSLTSRLLALGTWREALDLNRLIAQEEGSLQRLVPDSVAVLTILSPNLPRVPLRRQAVEQLLNTLVAHAGGSLTAGGTVTIITAIPPLTGGAPGPRVTLAVQASGEEVREPAVPELISLVERCKGSLNTTLDPQVGLLYEVVLPAERTQ